MSRTRIGAGKCECSHFVRVLPIICCSRDTRTKNSSFVRFSGFTTSWNKIVFTFPNIHEKQIFFKFFFLLFIFLRKEIMLFFADEFILFLECENPSAWGTFLLKCSFVLFLFFNSLIWKFYWNFGTRVPKSKGKWIF